MVVHWPHHPKVEGLNPCDKDGDSCKIVSLAYSVVMLSTKTICSYRLAMVGHLPYHPKAEGSSPMATGTGGDMTKSINLLNKNI